MYNEFQSITHESDECLSRGICTVSPTLSSLQEVILLYLKELAFYLLKLKGFGMANEEIKKIVLEALFNVVTNVEYNQENFHEIILQLDTNITQSKALYEKICLEKNVDIESVKTYFKHSKIFSLTEAIKRGEKYFLKKIHSFTPKQKDLFDIMLFLVKSISIKIVEIKRLGKDHNDAYYAVLSILNKMNLSINEFSEEEAKKEIEQIIKMYYDVARFVFLAQIELYGEIKETEVSFSAQAGKAILVSGSDYKKLELVLKATENTEIGVYTHGMEMLMAHAFPKIHSHPNLKGHFGLGLDTSLVDFASFPGAILMTKGTIQRIEYLYRGRLFTLDPIPSQGVVKLKDDNLEPLIKSALDAPGFTHAQHKPSIKVGFDEQIISNKINEIMDKIAKKEIKHLYIIGLLNYQGLHKQYFQKFFELMPKDCYAISLCHEISGKNIFHLNSFYDYSLIYKILKEMNEKIPLNEINMSAFITKCDQHIISNLLYLKHVGIKNVYMCKCPPTLISPPLMETLQETFDIKEFADAKKDLEDTLGEKL